eukprot:TRINITY_DN8164_c0_g1_i1.p1 TRINITY_DN8164_c0_g1~~TRINITY_DN8164_c0_g1_i1.p1  ORF type:complete len:546 (+),score=102.31 TRINITY_DN8164_c0_g1_i1:152-1639(+)
MPNLIYRVGSEGTQFTNMFATTPVCCPSRASILTGKYLHNTRVINDSVSGNCSSQDWKHGLEHSTIGTYLQNSGYETMYVGKYLNQYGHDNPDGEDLHHVPPGWNNWVGLEGSSVYYDYNLSINGNPVYHGSDYLEDYLPLVMLNHTLRWLDARTLHKPILLYYSPPSPHTPAVPAPEYVNYFENLKAPRTPGWNEKSTDKHWIVQTAGVYGEDSDPPMDSNVTSYSDLLYRRRLATLVTADDTIGTLLDTFEAMGILNDTVFIYTSDHGYHLGQNGLPLDKRMPYETDIRVPFFMRGPGVPENVNNTSPITTIDLLPTLMDIAGVYDFYSQDVDGVSILPLLNGGTLENSGRQWLIEYTGEHNNGGVKMKDHHIKKDDACQIVMDGVSCFSYDQFAQPPYYQGDPFCTCDDATNNTYRCLRTVNATHDWQYCEFDQDGGFIEFYDVAVDFWNLNNSASSLSPQVHDYLQSTLETMSACQGLSCQRASRFELESI